MKNLWKLWIFLLLSTLAVAQVDIRNYQPGPYRTLTRGAAWGSSGSGGFTNSYIFVPQNTSEGVCISVANNSANAHTFPLQLFGTTDPATTAYQGNTSQWTLLGPLNSWFLSGGITVNLAANTTIQLFAQINGQASVAIVAGTSTGTAGPSATITIAEMPSGVNGCGNNLQGPMFCPYQATASIASGTAANMVPGVAGLNVYVCNMTISAAAALAAGTVSAEYSAAAGCTSPSVAWTLATGATTPVVTTYQGVPLISTTNIADPFFCVANGQTTTIQVSINFAQF